jgi:flagellar protein FlaG
MEVKMSDLTLNNVMNVVSANNQHIDSISSSPSNPSKNVQNAANNMAGQTKTLDTGDIKKIINKINENVSMLNQNVKFAYNDTIKSLTVEVIDQSTGKVIRQIPPKEVVNLQKKLSEVVGIIYDSKEVK